MTWKTKLQADMVKLASVDYDFDKLTIKNMTDRHNTIKEYQSIDLNVFLQATADQILETTGLPWIYSSSIDPTNRRTNMLAVFKSRVPKHGLTSVSLFIYKTMLYGINDDMIYYRGAQALADDCMLGIATVYRHLKLLHKAGLIETVKQGYKYGDWGANSSIRLLG